MRRRGAIAIAALVAGGACGGARRVWIDACHWSASPARDAVVFADRDALVLRRTDGDHRVGYGGCTGDAAHVEGVLALDGWRALVWGYHAEGGNWSESGSVGDLHACVVDFHAGSQRAVDDALLGDPRLFEAQAGARSGWVYVQSLAAAPEVADLDHGRRAPFDAHGTASTETAIAEPPGGTSIVAVSAELEQVDPAHSIYKGSLVVRTFDAASWPPALRDTRTIAVGGRPDQVRVSADGRWAAYDGHPYHVGMESTGEVTDVGLVDLAAGKVAFEQLAQPGDADVGDIVIAGDRPFVLVTRQPDPYARDDAERTASWLDRDGRPAVTRSVRFDRLWWLADRKRALGTRMCRAALVDLPLP